MMKKAIEPQMTSLRSLDSRKPFGSSDASSNRCDMWFS